MTKIKFRNTSHSAFFVTLRSRVDQYFIDNKISRCGGNRILVKALFMLSLYFIPYFLIISGTFSLQADLLLTIIMGVGIAGVGMSVMHDAIHGSFSDHRVFNKIFGASLYILGGNVYNWEVQHNRLHHTYTNIHEVDEDITGKFLLRLSFQDKKKKIHRFQHVYAFFLYSLMTLSFLWKDFKEIRLFNQMSKTGLTKPYHRKEIIKLLITKLLYVIFIAVIPMYLLEISFGQWLLGFMLMHCTAGLILSTIFQLAHVVEGADQPYPDPSGCIENAWAIHQLQTTSNFSGSGRLFSWLVGGLDYQIEHHLFPSISHVYYRDISPIVSETASEFGLNYNSKGSFNKALISHIRMLRMLGTVETCKIQ